MKRSKLSLVSLVFISLWISCNQAKSSQNINEKEEIQTKTEENLVERGEYLVRIIGCDHCHTPKKMTDNGPVPDMDKWLMGYPAENKLPEIINQEGKPSEWILFKGDLTAAVGLWGVSFSANLTPSETGIGNWTFENFKTAMTKGKFKGNEEGRMLLPPMPWYSYKDMKEDDLKAIFEYLRSIKPIENSVPNAIPPTDL